MPNTETESLANESLLPVPKLWLDAETQRLPSLTTAASRLAPDPAPSLPTACRQRPAGGHDRHVLLGGANPEACLPSNDPEVACEVRREC